MSRLNALGQPIGEALPDWTPPPAPPHAPLQGAWARLEPLSLAAHGDDLWEAVQLDPEGRTWTWMSHGPFADRAALDAVLAGYEASSDPLFFAVRASASGRVEGLMSLMRITPAAGTIEVGNIWWGPAMQKTPTATQTIRLLMELVFSLGYRRLEWKCDHLNAASRKAAMRFGFSYEGVFRQALVYKGRTRDTAWYACIDSEWPALQAAYDRWLDPENFDAEGRQKTSLAELTAPILVARG